MDYTVTLLENCSRFQLTTEEGTAYLEYCVSENTMDLIHTFVPPPMEGKGIAGALVKAAFDYAGDNNLYVRTTCPYTAIWQKRHPEYNSRVIS